MNKSQGTRSTNDCRHGRRAIIISCVILVGMGMLTYANSLSGPFIFDDIYSIVNNPNIRDVWPLSKLMGAPTRSNATNGRPVVSLSLVLNYALGELNVSGYHAFNIAIHIAAALVLFGVVRRTLLLEKLRPRFGPAAYGIALTCALIWLVHPLQTECVNYTSQRTESIMGLFYLLTMYAAIRSLDSGRRSWWIGTSILCCMLGMASKESMVTAPLMVMLYDWAFHSGSILPVRHKRWRLYVGLMATWIILAALNWSGPRSETVGFTLGVSAWDYALNQCIMIVRYLRLAFWPSPLVLDYGFPNPLSVGATAPYAAVLLGLLIATAVTLVYRPMIGFSGAWLFLILGPTSSFIPIINEVGAERRMYLPLAGLIALVVTLGYLGLDWTITRWRTCQRSAIDAIADGAEKYKFNRVWVLIAPIAVVAMLTWTTIKRNQDYQSQVSIWKTSVQAVPGSHRAQYNLGYALRLKGDIDAAIWHYRQALQIKPDYAKAHFNLGNALQTQGDTSDAIAHYRQALQSQPRLIRAHINLGNLLQSEGNIDAAVQHYRQALQINPHHAIAHYNLGSMLQVQGQLSDAIAHYRQALQSQPMLIEAHINLGNLLRLEGKTNEAMQHYQQALQLQRTMPTAVTPATIP